MDKAEHDRYNDYRKPLGLRPARQCKLHIFLGDTTLSTDYGFMAHDHATLFLKDGKPYSYVVQPYKGRTTQADIDDLERFCREHHLRYRILPEGEEWYNPGRTLCIELTHDLDSPRELAPYVELLKRLKRRLKQALRELQAAEWGGRVPKRRRLVFG